MKPFAAALGALALFAILAGRAGAERFSAIPLHDEPQALPDIAFADAKGGAVTLERWRGKVVLLNIWAT